MPQHKSISSAWITLQHELFRVLWIASVASNIGTLMQDVGASWLMTQLAPTPLMVSLIQTAGSLPLFLLSFTAGALADILDRRRLLIFSQSWMLGAAAGLGILTVFHLHLATDPADLHLPPRFRQRLEWTGLVGDRAGARSPRRGGGSRLDQLGKLQRGARGRSGAGRTGGRGHRFRRRLPAQCCIVPGSYRGVLPLAARAPQERAAGRARGGSHEGRMAIRGPRSVNPFHAGLRFPVLAGGERLLELGAIVCTPGAGARGRRLWRLAGIFWSRCGAQRIHSAAPAADWASCVCCATPPS